MQIIIDGQDITNTLLLWLACIVASAIIQHLASNAWQTYKANKAYRRQQAARDRQIVKLGKNAVLAVELAEWRKDRDRRGLDSV